MFDGVHPNFWSFIKGLKREAASQFGLLTQARAGNDPPRQKKKYTSVNNRLRNLIQRHEGGMDTAEFLRGVGHNINLNI